MRTPPFARPLLLSTFTGLLAIATSASAIFEPPVFHDGISVVRATVSSARDLKVLLALSRDTLTHRLDYGPAEFLFDASAMKALSKTGIAFQVLVPDLGPVLRADLAAREEAANAEGGIAGADFFADFRTIDQINAKLDSWVAARPDLVSTFVVGMSLEGRIIRGVRFTKAPAGSPGVLFNSAQHAREWGAAVTTMFIGESLITGYGVNPRITDLLDHAWIDIIPVVNPDGYVYTWTTNRLWRKNRRDNGDGTFGVDLNRNWAFQWGGGGASTNPVDETYRGVAAFSEPESAAMRDYFVSHPTLVGHIDFHSYSQLVLSPWGYTTALDGNNDALVALGREMKDAIARTTGATYTAGPIASTLYIASGSAVDHAYGAHGVPSYTIEVRDNGSYGFVMPASEILPTGAENFAASLQLAETTLAGAVIRLPSGAPTSVDAGVSTTLTTEIRTVRGTLTAGGLKLFHRPQGSAGAFTQVNGVSLGSGVVTFALPATACSATFQWYINASTQYGTARLPHTPNAYFATVATDASVLFQDTFETNLNWVVGATGDNASSGQWTRVDPVGTTAQPENDSFDAGALCFVTGQGVVGGGAGAADVDGGTTSLVSPSMNAVHPNAMVSYRRWYSNSLGGAPNADSMPVQISGDGGVTWLQLEDVTENASAWVERAFAVASYITPTANMKLRFQARDLATGSLIEAGVDDVRVAISGCPTVTGDLNADGVVDAADLAIMLNNWGGSGATDLDSNGITDAADIAALLNAWT